MMQLLPTRHNKLIALVRDQSVLWDKGDENYKNRVEKEKAWLTVAEGIVKNFSELPRKPKASTTATSNTLCLFILTAM